MRMTAYRRTTTSAASVADQLPWTGAGLAIVSGHSGTGKNSTVKLLQETLGDLAHFNVSDTTRAPRSGEEDGEHYNFITMSEFEARIARGHYLEHARIHGGNYYGTPKASIEAAFREGKLTILDIDIQGVQQLLPIVPDAFFSFLYSDDLAEIRQRMIVRGSMTTEELEERLLKAPQERELAMQLLPPEHCIQTATVKDHQGTIMVDQSKRATMHAVGEQLLRHADEHWPPSDAIDVVLRFAIRGLDGVL